MPFSEARYRWRARLDFYAAAGITLPVVRPLNDEDVAAMQRPASPVEQAARPNGAFMRRPRPDVLLQQAPDVRPARPLTDSLDLSDG